MLNLKKKLSCAAQTCSKKGVKLTVKRTQILTALLLVDKAISAYDISALCKEKFNLSIPAMSVYRILDFLCKHGLAHKLNLANKYVACNNLSDNYTHAASQFLICVSCNKVKEISINQTMHDAVQAQANQVGFAIVNPKLEINGICLTCKQA